MKNWTEIINEEMKRGTNTDYNEQIVGFTTQFSDVVCEVYYSKNSKIQDVEGKRGEGINNSKETPLSNTGINRSLLNKLGKINVTTIGDLEGIDILRMSSHPDISPFGLKPQAKFEIFLKENGISYTKGGLKNSLRKNRVKWDVIIAICNQQRIKINSDHVGSVFPGTTKGYDDITLEDCKGLRFASILKTSGVGRASIEKLKKLLDEYNIFYIDEEEKRFNEKN